jgi:hypothetical protein
MRYRAGRGRQCAYYSSESDWSGSFRRVLIICEQLDGCKSNIRNTHLVQPGLELVDLALLDQDVLLVQLLDDVFVAVLAVNVHKHGFDGRVALDERAWGVSIFAIERRGEVKTHLE